MSSAFDQEFAEAALPDLFTQFGESLTLHPLGVAANAVLLTAVFNESEPVDFRDRGQGLRRRATVTTDAAMSSLAVSDRWLRGSEEWEAQSIRDCGSYREVVVTKTGDEFRNGKPGMVL